MDMTVYTGGIPGPYIIGGTGGSGTRVLARIVRRGGLFIGTNLNDSEDALDFGEYSDRWINVWWGRGASAALPAPPPEMILDLQRVLQQHVAPLTTARAWGWKEPRSLFLLPFWHRQLPTLKFVHVIRDGRDMAYSSNQNQVRKHGHVLVERTDLEASEPVRAMALWSRLNLWAADYGETRLRTQYLRIWFEDLCRQPVPTIARLLAFFGLSGAVEPIAQLEVAPPSSLGRWRTQERATLVALHRVGRAALARFGYQEAAEESEVL